MIIDQINADLISAMKDRTPENKEKNQFIVMNLRTLLSEIKTFQMNNKRPPDDIEVAGILAKGIKQFKETLEKAAGQNEAGVVREDIVEKEKSKIAIYQKYMPAQMEKGAIEILVNEAITESGAKSPKDMGAVMAILRPKTQGRADGKMVSDIVKAKLAG